MALVVVFVIVKAIAANPVTGHAFDRVDFAERIIIGLPPGIAKVVVT